MFDDKPTPVSCEGSEWYTPDHSIISVVELSDGSIVSCSTDTTARRWLIVRKDDSNSNYNDAKKRDCSADERNYDDRKDNYEDDSLRFTKDTRIPLWV